MPQQEIILKIEMLPQICILAFGWLSHDLLFHFHTFIIRLEYNFAGNGNIIKRLSNIRIVILKGELVSSDWIPEKYSLKNGKNFISNYLIFTLLFFLKISNIKLNFWFSCFIWHLRDSNMHFISTLWIYNTFREKGLQQPWGRHT